MTSITVLIKGKPGVVLDKIADDVSPTMARAVLKGANHAGGVINEVVNETFPNSSGALGGSFTPASFVESTVGVAAGALSDLVHAGILDQGGTIVPRTAKMLAIPLTGFAEDQWPRDLPKGMLAYVETKKGTHLLIDAQSKSLIVHYVLKPEVTIDPRFYLAAAAERAAPRVAEIMGEEIAETIDEAGG